MPPPPNAPVEERIARATREIEERYRFLAEAVPVQIWTALPDGNLDYVTEQTASYFGMPSSQLLAEGWQNVVHPDDLGNAVARWTDSLKSGEPYEIEFRLKLSNGSYAWHLGRAIPQRDPAGRIVRWFGTNTNIEEQREQRTRAQALHDAVAKHAEELQERNRLLGLEADIGLILTGSASLAETLSACAASLVRHLDAAFVRIWTLDEHGTTLELRASAGMYTHLDGPHGRVPVGALKIGLIAAERTPHVTNRVAEDARIGDRAWAAREGMVAFAGYPLVLGERLVGVVAAFSRRAFTGATTTAMKSIANGLALAIERRRIEDERERLLASTQEARQKAELASRAKDEFLATASHELRTPLNAILGWVRMLRTGTLDATARARATETIERNANAQVKLVEDILDGSRIITGKLHLEIRSMDLAAVVSAALDAVRPAADAKNITLTVVLEPDGARIKGDPDRLQQVVWNLVNNAIKFTQRGGAIGVSVRRVGTSIELVVEDDGLGIGADFLPYVFERFRQADATTTRSYGGLGLGLALVRHLAEAHGGVVRAESEGAGRGAKFVVTLPVQAVLRDEGAEPAKGAGKPASNGKEPAGSLRGIRVLVTDDEEDARDLVATVLGMHDADVVTAASADEAILQIARHAPAVLVSDIGMPGADGYALIARVRALPTKASTIPALALTAYARGEDRRRALAAGFQTYLAKPADPDELVRVVLELAGAARSL